MRAAQNAAALRFQRERPGIRANVSKCVLASPSRPRLSDVGARFVVIGIAEGALGVGRAQHILGLGGIAARQVADLELGARRGVGLRAACRRPEVGRIVDDAAQRDRRAFGFGRGGGRRRPAV